MIESNILGAAVGIQNQGVIDKTEGTSLPSLANGVIIGRFKRGRMDKPFTVTASNYQALLGRDPSNPSYLAVEDAFKRGISEVSILRVGDGLGKSEGSGGDNSLVNFIKIDATNQLFSSDRIGDKVGLAISMDGGPIVPWFSVVRDEYGQSPTVVQAIIEPLQPHPRYTVSRTFEAFDMRNSDYPDELSSGFEKFDYLFGFGVDAADRPLPSDFVEGLVTLTLYPASAHQTNLIIDYDLFDFIIDPEHYTPAELQFFASKGITPAIKNADGSYTIKSQLTTGPRPTQ